MKLWLNSKLRGKTLLKNHIFFGGGCPIFRYLPRTYMWGDTRSIFWLGTELCIRFKESK